MGMSARILALGRYSASLAPLLSHPREAYASLREGAIIVEVLAPRAPGSTSSRALAEALGVSPWDFATHAFPPEAVDRTALLRVLDGWAEVGDAPAVVARFEALAAAGFRFFFRPEG